MSFTPFRSQDHLTKITTSETQGINRLEVFTTLEPVILTQDKKAKGKNVQFIGPGDDLTVHGDRVCIRGPLLLNGRTVKIHARILEGEKDSKGQAPAINVSGVDGLAPPLPKTPLISPAPAASGTYEKWIGVFISKTHPGSNGSEGAEGSKGAPGSAGLPGGKIILSCEQIANSITTLSLIAEGGRGGKGQQGQQGQQGQAGGAGNPDAKGGPAGVGMINGSAGGDGGKGGRGGDGGRGGFGGNGGSIEVHVVEKSSKSKITQKVSAGKIGTPGDRGDRGDGGAAGVGTTWWIAAESIWEANINFGTHPNGSTGGPGAYGKKGTNPKNPATNGQSVNNYGTATHHDLAGFSAVSQRQMLVHRARSVYLSAHSEHNLEGFAETARLLTFLSKTTISFVDGLILEPFQSIEISQFKRINQQAQTLILQLRTGKDYFGHLNNFAPRTSYQRLTDQLKGVSQYVQQIESTSTAYFNQLNSTQEAEQQLRSAINSAENIAHTLEASAKALEGRLTSLDKDIRAADDLVTLEQVAFKKSIAHLASALQKNALLSAGNIAKALSKLSVPSGPSDVKAIAGIVKTTAGLVQDQIKAFDKAEFEITRVDTLGDRIATLGDIVKNDKNSPEGYLVVASQKRFEDALKPYTTILEADGVRDALERLVMTCMTRNNLILDRAGIAARRLDQLTQAEQSREQKRETESALAKNLRPDLPEISAFVDTIYLDARNYFLEQIYYAGRAFSFWSLKPYDLFKNVSGLKTPTTLNHAILEREHQSILKAHSAELEERGAAPQHFPPVGKEDVPGVIWRIDETNFPGAIEQLRAKGETLITLPAPGPKTPIRKNPFAGKSLVRITHIRPWAHGLTTDNNRFTIEVTHGGTHEFYSLSDRQILMTQSVARSFDYGIVEVEETEQTAIYQDGKIGESDPQKREYALVSPFTTWRIRISDTLNLNLNRKKLSAIELEFHGENFPF